MDYKLGVLVLHGIGAQTANFADGFIEEVNARLGQLSEAVRWKPVWWAPVLDDAEASLLRDLSANNRLDYMKLRRFVVHALGDAVAYQRVADGHARKDVYDAVHAVVADRLHDLWIDLHQGLPPGAPERPLLVVAHSLGCHIISNHIWDLQHEKNPRIPTADNAFERAETLAGMVTLGCNIPLFALAYNNMVPIRFPASQLARVFPPDTSPAKLSEAARWQNLYDPDDILGYPLRPLSKAYEHTVRQDRAVNVGGLTTSWNPASHLAYWTDNDVTQPVAEQIADLLALL